MPINFAGCQYEAFSLRSVQQIVQAAKTAVFHGFSVTSCNLSDPVEHRVWLKAWEQETYARFAARLELAQRPKDELPKPSKFNHLGISAI